MLILYFICCLLQPICFPFPEIITVLWGMKSIGVVPAFLLGVLGTVLGIACMYTLSCNISEWMICKFKCTNQIETFKVYTRQYKILIIGVLFIIPILPDEIIAIGAPLIGVKFHHFLVIAVISKVVSIGMITFSEQIGRIYFLDKWQMIMLELVLLYIFSFIVKRKSALKGA